MNINRLTEKAQEAVVARPSNSPNGRGIRRSSRSTCC